MVMEIGILGKVLYTVVGDRNLSKSLYSVVMGIGTVGNLYIPWWWG
jgi:hypothetical protein